MDSRGNTWPSAAKVTYMPKNQVSTTLHLRKKESVFPLIPKQNGVDCEQIQETKDHRLFRIAGHKNDVAKFVSALIMEQYPFDLNIYPA